MKQQFYLGIVEDRSGDPLKLGRVRVRVFGVHSESTEDVPTSSLPWAIPIMPATSASLSGIGQTPAYVEGSLVFVFFIDGESKQQPIILGSAAGVPQEKSPFGSTGVFVTESFNDTTPVEPVANVGFDGDGANSIKPEVPETNPDGSLVTLVEEPAVIAAPTPPAAQPTGVDCTAAVRKYGSNVTAVYNALLAAGITNNNAVIAILSNVGKESKFIAKRENMNYSTLKQLRAVFKTATQSLTDLQASELLNNPQRLANLVYANSEGNGNSASGDGFKYRGGGFIQLTKRNNYTAIGTAIGVDIVTDSDRILVMDVAAKVVAAYFIYRFGGANRLSFSSVDEALTVITKKVNPGGFARDYPLVVVESKLYTSGTKLSDQQEKEIAKPNDPENQVKKDATREEINAGLISKKTVTSNELGFKDPSEKYPLSSLLNEPDSNRLTRRNVNETIVTKRRRNRRTNIKSTGIDSFAEPTASYNAQYPYNKVHSTESGHVLEFDDTYGAERINLFHTTGTFVEIDANGNQVNKIIGDNFSITESNGYIYIDGVARVSVGGDVKLKVGGNLDIDVDGDLNYTVKGNINTKVGKNTVTNVTGNSLYNIKGTANYNYIGACSYNAWSSFNVTSKSVEIQTSDHVVIKSKVMAIGSTGEMHVKGKKLHLNGDIPITETVLTKVPVVMVALNTSTTPISYNNPENFVDSEIVKLDDADPLIVAAEVQKQISSGLITQKQLDNGQILAAKTTVVKDTAPPTATLTAVPESCALFETPNGLSENIQISKSFTLAMVSSKAAVSRNVVVAQRGLSKPQIACNLKRVAENCLDQIKIQYPNMFVTSGFRPGGGTSQHELGEAVDLQFKGADRQDYYAIAVWIKNNIVFDKLLLEYKTTGSGMPWIHISYKPSPRREVYTYMNNAKVSNDIRKLQ